MIVFRSARDRFYLIVGLLLLLFGIIYLQLAGFLNRLSASTERVQTATLIDKEIRWLGEEFWRLRFWEQLVQSQTHPEADQQFGYMLKQIKERIAVFDPGLFTEQLSGNMSRIAALLSQYEELFNRLIQLGTEQRLNRTQLESNYQVLTSTILLHQNPEFLNPLLNFDRFLDRYLATHKDSEYKALNLLFSFLRTKLSSTAMMDERLESYITKLSTLIEHDFALEQEITAINQDVDRISQELTVLFVEISQTMETLSSEAAQAGERLRKIVQQHLLFSAVAASMVLLLIIWMIAKQIIDPLRQLSATVMQVKGGNDQVRFTSKARDEIAELGFAFNELLDTIQQHRYRLEALVEERTEKLIETNAQLQQEITKHQHTERALQHAKDAAEVANKAKSVFLANMSHELRTPLNGILGFTQIMTRSSSLDPTQREHLNIIHHSGEHLLTLINQVLDLSKIEAGHIVLDEVNFDIYEVLGDIEKMFRARAEEKHLHLFVDRNYEIPQYLRTDVVRLRQVLINLLNNAIKFTKKGSVRLRVREIDAPEKFSDEPGAGNPTLHRPNDSALYTYLQFSVEDTGPGIALEEQEDLFKAFAQTRAGQELQGGTGLGLSICRKFVQLMKGDITVESQIGRGSTFTFHVRVEKIDPDAIETRHKTRRVMAVEPGQPRYRILVVDDRLINRQLLSKLLLSISSASAGFDVREAANGEEALAMWKEWDPDLIWMDIRMPVMNGYDATKQIKNTDKGRETIVIALTAISLEDEEKVAVSVGCNDFLRKPFHEADIFHLLNKHLGVRFLYEADTKHQEKMPDFRDIVTPEALALLSNDLRRDLSQAIETIDLDLTLACVERVRGQNEYLAKALVELVNNYRFDILQEILNIGKNIQQHGRLKIPRIT